MKEELHRYDLYPSDEGEVHSLDDTLKYFSRSSLFSSDKFGIVAKQVVKHTCNSMQTPFLSLWLTETFAERLFAWPEEGQREEKAIYKGSIFLHRYPYLHALLRTSSAVSRRSSAQVPWSRDLGKELGWENESSDWLFAPIVLNGLIAGVIYLESREQGRLFSPEEENFVSTIANYLSISLGAMVAHDELVLRDIQNNLLELSRGEGTLVQYALALQEEVSRWSNVEVRLCFCSRSGQDLGILDSGWSLEKGSPVRPELSNVPQICYKALRQPMPILINQINESALVEDLKEYCAINQHRTCLALAVVGPDGSPNGVLLALGGSRKEFSSNVTQRLFTCAQVSAIAIERCLDEEEWEENYSKALEKSGKKTKFVSYVNHEIRSPLSTILSYAEYAKETPTEEKRQKALDVIVKNCHYLLYLVNDITDLARIEAGRLKIDFVSCDLRGLVRDVCEGVHSQAETKGLFLHFLVDDTVPSFVSTDPQRLRQVLINLIANAIKFTESGGVTVTVKAGSLLRELEIVVADTGPGFSAATAAKIFEPFEQGQASEEAKRKGSGLGLTISKELIDILGGTLSVKSEEGRGTQFTVCLPLGDKLKELEGNSVAEKPKVTESQEVSPRLSGRVLLVDDCQDNLEIMALTLKRIGLDVETALDGQKARAIAQKQNLDLILMDIEMPGMNGYEAAQIIRSDGCQVPILALSAHSRTSERAKELSSGFEGWIEKPVTASSIRRVLRRYLLDEGDLSSITSVQGNHEDGAFEARYSVIDQEMVKDPAMCAALLAFKNTLPVRSDSLVCAQEKEDWDAVEKIAHQLAGVGSAYGFPDITRHGRALESAVQHGHIEQARTLTPKVVELIKQARLEIDAVLAR